MIKNRQAEGSGSITDDGVYKMVASYAAAVLIDLTGFGSHTLWVTAATDALDHDANIAKVQEWLGHANIAITCIHDRRKTGVEETLKFIVLYS